MKMDRKYASELTNRQWQLICPLLPARACLGRRPIDRRRIVDAILYVVRTGCQWRMLPKDFPNWSMAYGVFGRWWNDEAWERVHDALREKVRRAEGKKSTPTVAIIDSQSIRTAEGGEERGYDAAKKITGRKRHLAVDTLEMLLAVVVHRGDWQAQDGGCGGWSRSSARNSADLDTSIIRLDPANCVTACGHEGVRRLAETVNCRTHIRLVGTLPPA